MTDFFAYTSQGRNHVNQDIYGFEGQVCWVLDGATPLFGDDYLGGNDVQKTMQKINDALHKNGRNEYTPADHILKACLAVNDEYRKTIPGYEDVEAYKLPTFALAIVSYRNGIMQYCVLGDCEIRTSSGIHIKDHRFDHINTMNQQNETDIKKDMHISDLHALDKKTYQKYYEKKIKADQLQRSYLNTEGKNGYWIGSLDGKGLFHAYSGSVKLFEGETVYLYCDGFAHLLENHPALLERLSKDAIDHIRDETSDDVTVISFKA